LLSGVCGSHGLLFLSVDMVFVACIRSWRVGQDVVKTGNTERGMESLVYVHACRAGVSNQLTYQGGVMGSVQSLLACGQCFILFFFFFLSHWFK